jgi:ABC-type transport system involved in multi-copper enzyme maturation permease subunit
MIQLLIKDLRVHRMALLAAAALWTIGPAITWLTWLLRGPSMAKYGGDYISTMGFAALFLTIALAALLGGDSFAAERRDKTADFLAMLPVTRRKIILSKLILGAAIILILWAMALGTLVLSTIVTPMEFRQLGGDTQSPWYPILCCMALTIMAYGTSWLLSIFLKEPLGATILAVMGMVAIMTLVGVYVSRNRMTDEDSFWMFSYLPLVVGIFSWIAGSCHYARRVEP